MKEGGLQDVKIVLARLIVVSRVIHRVLRADKIVRAIQEVMRVQPERQAQGACPYRVAQMGAQVQESRQFRAVFESDIVR